MSVTSVTDGTSCFEVDKWKSYKIDIRFQKVKVLVTQWCSTLCDTMDCSPPGSSGIFQARILEWVAISYSRGSSWPNDGIHISCISCIGRWILYHCTTWEAHVYACLYINKDYLIIMYSHYMWHGTVLSESGWVSCKCILQSLGQPLTKVKKKKSITDLLGKKRK